MINLNQTPNAVLTIPLNARCTLDGIEFVVAAEAVVDGKKTIVLTTVDSRCDEYNAKLTEVHNAPDQTAYDNVMEELYQNYLGKISMDDMVAEPKYHSYIKHVRLKSANTHHTPARVARAEMAEKLVTGDYFIG